MIITAEQAEQLNAVDAYAIASFARVNGRVSSADEKIERWEGLTVEVMVSISGYGETQGNATPTWQASSSGDSLEEAFARALAYAPGQLAETNARASGRMADLLPEFDPDGTRFPKRKRQAKVSGPKLSLADLTSMFDL